MTMLMTSAFADDCSIGAACSDAAACKAVLGSLVDGKCVNPTSSQKETDCSGIVSSNAAKVPGGSTTDSAATGAKTEGR